jgi:hypothetical protein
LQMPTRQVETVERKVAETSVGNPSRHMQLRVFYIDVLFAIYSSAK